MVGTQWAAHAHGIVWVLLSVPMQKAVDQTKQVGGILGALLTWMFHTQQYPATQALSAGLQVRASAALSEEPHGP